MEYVLGAILIGLIPAAIAQSKGKSFIMWWLYGAALFIVALPHSLMVNAHIQEVDREQVQSGPSRKCPFCAEIIKAEAIVCRFCGRDLPAAAPQEVQPIVRPPEKIIDEEELDKRFKAWQKGR